MYAQILLADSAQADVATGKVSMLGAGWTVTSAPLPAMAVVVLLRLEPNATLPMSADITLSLVDQHGSPVTPPGGAVSFTGRLDAQRVEWPESETSVPWILETRAGLPLTAGQMYRWVATVNDNEVGSASFFVTPAAVLDLVDEADMEQSFEIAD